MSIFEYFSLGEIYSRSKVDLQQSELFYCFKCSNKDCLLLKWEVKFNCVITEMEPAFPTLSASQKVAPLGDPVLLGE